MIDEMTIRKVKEAAGIVDVIGDFYDLRKSGTEYECKCPFHQDRHIGSFKISLRKNYAKCFSCGWQGGPIDFLMEHEHLSFADAVRWLGKKYCIEVEGSENFKVKSSLPRQMAPALPMLVLPDWMWQIRTVIPDEDTLVRWIMRRNWDGAQRGRIYEALDAYHIGHSKNGMTIFWLIDEQQRVRTGKMMLYKADGHRNKEERYNFGWVHSALYRDERNPYSADKTDVKCCLFGLHLLHKYDKPGIRQDVCIVESEKTALIMAIAYGNNAHQVWMACGGVGNINRDRLAPLIKEDRNIILYPDRDGVDAWKKAAASLNYEHVRVDDKPVTEWWKPEDGPKADIADVVLRMMDKKKTYKTVDEVIEDLPIIKKMVNKLGLEIYNEER